MSADGAPSAATGCAIATFILAFGTQWLRSTCRRWCRPSGIGSEPRRASRRRTRSQGRSTTSRESALDLKTARRCLARDYGPRPADIGSLGGRRGSRYEEGRGGAFFCKKCQMWLNGVEQWGDHIIGRKHKRAAWRRVVARERLVSERAAGAGGERAAAVEGAAA